MGHHPSRDGRRRHGNAASGHLHNLHRQTTINDDGGGDDGDGDGPALEWPLPKRQRLRIRESFFVAIAWGSHLLNSDVSIMEIGLSNEARWRAARISLKGGIHARTARASNPNRVKCSLRRSFFNLDKCVIWSEGAPRSRMTNVEGKTGAELSLGKPGNQPLNLNFRE
jgi:hypothetical protein